MSKNLPAPPAGGRGYVKVTAHTGEAFYYPGGDWVHKTPRGALQVRKGAWRRLARWPAGTYASFVTCGPVVRVRRT